MLYHNILLIDDDEDDLEIFQAALQSVTSSVECKTFVKASEALLNLTSKTLIPDLIFLDLNMPVISGQEFLMTIKKDEFLRDIPVIVFSTSSSSRTAEEARNLGAHAFVTKPDNFEDFKRILKSYLGLS